jgi:uncharacterized phage-like protein YoqJ
MDQLIRREPQFSPYHPEGGILRCAFTGYRPQNMPFGFHEEDIRCVDFKQRIRYVLESLVKGGYSHFLTGGAIGFDTFAAEAVMGIRRHFRWITLEVAIPFDAQPEHWEAYSKLRYEWILNQADIVTWVSHAFSRECMRNRNHYLVDHCDLLLAAYDGRPGGTKHTVDYAQSQGKEIRLIPPILSETRMWIWDYDHEHPSGAQENIHYAGNCTTA